MKFRLLSRVKPLYWGLASECVPIYKALRHDGIPVNKERGKSVLSQLREIVLLRLGTGKLAPDEYYQYCLYDDNKYRWGAKKQFLGRRWEQALIPVLKSSSWVAVAHDKLLSYALFESFSLPSPEIYAVYHDFRLYGQSPCFNDPQSLAEFLRGAAKYPFVAKPIEGMWGKRIFAVESFDKGNDLLCMANGKTIAVETFITEVTDPKGFLFQELLKPHPTIVQLCGDRICTVRLVLILHKNEPRVLSAVWKVATGQNVADNYWEKGNLMGRLNIQTGRVETLFNGLGRHLRYVEMHPDTGKTLKDAVLPDWEQAVETCIHAAACLSGLRMQAWDIALTSHGPVLLEVNIIGGLRAPQLAAQAGIYNGEFRDFLVENGF